MRRLLRLGLIVGILCLINWLPAEAYPLTLCADKAGQPCTPGDDAWCWYPGRRILLGTPMSVNAPANFSARSRG
jgi:hypothetical protein